MLFGRQEPVGQVSVIGNEEKALCIQVQPSHRKQVLPFFIRDQIQDRGIFFILRGGDHALGLVEHIILHNSVGDLLTV